MIKEIIMGGVVVIIAWGFKISDFEWWWWLAWLIAVGIMGWWWGKVKIKKIKFDWWLAAILVVSLSCRLIMIETKPTGVWIDEVEANMAGKSYLKTLVSGKILPFFDEATGHPALSMIISGVSLRFLDQTILGLRLPSVFFGSLSVGLFYLLLREIVTIKTARIISLMLATSYWHLSLSRLGFEAGYYWFFEALVLFLLLKARKDSHYWVWVGMGLGWGNYTYLAFRTLSIALLVVGIGTVLLNSKEKIRDLIWLGMPILLIMAPLFFYSRRNPEIVWYRSGDVSIFNQKFDGKIDRIKMIGANTVSAVRMMIDMPDPNTRHNAAQIPAVDLIVVGLASIGWMIFIKRKKWIGAVLIIWLAGVTMANGILTYEPPYIIQPHSLRMLGLIIIIYGLVAVGWEKVKFNLKWGLAVISIMINLFFYFKPSRSEKQIRETMEPQTLAALEAKKKCPEEIRNEFYSASHFKFFAPNCQPLVR